MKVYHGSSFVSFTAKTVKIIIDNHNNKKDKIRKKFNKN